MPNSERRTGGDRFGHTKRLLSAHAGLFSPRSPNSFIFPSPLPRAIALVLAPPAPTHTHTHPLQWHHAQYRSTPTSPRRGAMLLLLLLPLRDPCALASGLLRRRVGIPRSPGPPSWSHLSALCACPSSRSGRSFRADTRCAPPVVLVSWVVMRGTSSALSVAQCALHPQTAPCSTRLQRR